MKEKYVKPAMVIERFSLTSSIARNCADYIDKQYLNQSSIPNCTWDLGGGMTVFVQFPTCIIEAPTWDAGNGEIICYNNPGEGAYIFSS